jgi:hypothetical protein
MSLLCKDLVDVAALGEVDASKFVSRGRFVKWLDEVVHSTQCKAHLPGDQRLQRQAALGEGPPSLQSGFA